MQRYEEHELSRLLPMMGDADLNALAADIRENGLRAPITLLEGKILDGRNRYKACKIAQTEPRFRDFNGDGDPLAFILSANVHRRHLTTSQRAMIAADLETMRHGKPREKEGDAHISREQVAKDLNVSPRSVATAKGVLAGASKEDIQAVKRGEKTINEVSRQLKTQPAENRKAETPQKQLDKTGYAIPESVLPDSNSATETRKQLLTKIPSVRSELNTALNKQDIIFAEVTNTTVADLDNA